MSEVRHNSQSVLFWLAGASTSESVLAGRSLNILNELQSEGDGIGLHTPGSIRLIEKGNEARYLEAKQHETYNHTLRLT